MASFRASLRAERTAITSWWLSELDSDDAPLFTVRQLVGRRGPSCDALLSALAPATPTDARLASNAPATTSEPSVFGPLLAAALVGVAGIRNTLLLAATLGLFAAREARTALAPPADRRRFSLNLSALRDAGLMRTLLPVMLFEGGNLANTLLIPRATDLLQVGNRSLTAAASLAILLYAAHNSIATLASLAGGRIIDKVGARPVFSAAAAMYVAAYATFAAGLTPGS